MLTLNNCQNLTVLGIESSCDESAVAIYNQKKGLLAHQVYSQVGLHAVYGGVVPELASRDHIKRMVPLIKEVLGSAKLELSDVDGIAYTAGPGLLGALMVGASVGRSLAWSLNIPAVGIHHLEGHILAPMLESNPPVLPYVGLLVSGGHTLLIKVEKLGRYEILGESVDDAVGEAFDKTAKMLGLDYPGGPALEKLAKDGCLGRFNFPRPMTDRPGLDFSFSGLKTHALYTFRENKQDDQTRADIACAFQKAVADTLVIKCRRALLQTGFESLVVAGGVGANQFLRGALKDMVDQLNAQLFFPRPEFCVDNGAMIAYAGYLRLRSQQFTETAFEVKARWRLDDLKDILF